MINISSTIISSSLKAEHPHLSFRIPNSIHSTKESVLKVGPLRVKLSTLNTTLGHTLKAVISTPKYEIIYLNKSDEYNLSELMNTLKICLSRIVHSYNKQPNAKTLLYTLVSFSLNLNPEKAPGFQNIYEFLISHNGIPYITSTSKFELHGLVTDFIFSNNDIQFGTTIPFKKIQASFSDFLSRHQNEIFFKKYYYCVSKKLLIYETYFIDTHFQISLNLKTNENNLSVTFLNRSKKHTMDVNELNFYQLLSHSRNEGCMDLLLNPDTSFLKSRFNIINPSVKEDLITELLQTFNLDELNGILAVEERFSIKQLHYNLSVLRLDESFIVYSSSYIQNPILLITKDFDSLKEFIYEESLQHLNREISYSLNDLFNKKR